MRRGRPPSPRNNSQVSACPKRPAPPWSGACFIEGLLVALTALALGVGGCGLNPHARAVRDITAFLDAVQRDDAAAVEAALDRPALRANLRDQLAGLGRANGIDVGNGPSEFAMDRMITLQTIRRAGAHTSLPAGPSLAQVELVVRMDDKTHACVLDAARQRCALNFASRGGAWRMVGMLATAPNP